MSLGASFLLTAAARGTDVVPGSRVLLLFDNLFPNISKTSYLTSCYTFLETILRMRYQVLSRCFDCLLRTYLLSRGSPLCFPRSVFSATEPWGMIAMSFN
jgi:hypothetical protein